MRKSIVLKVVGLATVGVMLLAGTALAGSWRAKTSLSVSASMAHHHATFTGSLKSSRKACMSNQRVQLVRSGDNIVASTRTSSTGAYHFGHSANKGSNWFVMFAGSTTGTHPSTHVCNASQSSTIRF